MEALRNDLGDAGEYVAGVKLDGVSMGSCKPNGGDYDCTFFQCPLSGVKEVVSASGKIIVEMHYKGHSWDCDCDMQSWTCSRESTVAGRKPMTAVMRFTLMPQTKAPTPAPTAEPTTPEPTAEPTAEPTNATTLTALEAAWGGAYRGAQVSGISVLVFVLLSLRM